MIKERLEVILVSLIFDIETLIKTRTACQLEDKLNSKKVKQLLE